MDRSRQTRLAGGRVDRVVLLLALLCLGCIGSYFLLHQEGEPGPANPGEVNQPGGEPDERLLPGLDGQASPPLEPAEMPRGPARKGQPQLYVVVSDESGTGVAGVLVSHETKPSSGSSGWIAGRIAVTNQDGVAPFLLRHPTEALEYFPSDTAHSFTISLPGSTRLRQPITGPVSDGAVFRIVLREPIARTTVQLVNERGAALSVEGSAYVSSPPSDGSTAGSRAITLPVRDGKAYISYPLTQAPLSLTCVSSDNLWQSGASQELPAGRSRADIEHVVYRQPQLTFRPTIEGKETPAGTRLKVSLELVEGSDDWRTLDSVHVEVDAAGVVTFAARHLASALAHRPGNTFRVRASLFQPGGNHLVGLADVPDAEGDERARDLGFLNLSRPMSILWAEGVIESAGGKRLHGGAPWLSASLTAKGDPLPTRLEFDAHSGEYRLFGESQPPKAAFLRALHRDATQTVVREVQLPTKANIALELGLRLSVAVVVDDPIYLQRLYCRLKPGQQYRGQSLDLGGPGVEFRGVPPEGTDVELVLRESGVVVAQVSVGASDTGASIHEPATLDARGRLQHAHLRLVTSQGRALNEGRLYSRGGFVASWRVDSRGEVFVVAPDKVRTLELFVRGYSPFDLDLGGASNGEIQVVTLRAQ